MRTQFHYPGSLAASVQEAESRNVDLLSYSPEQENEKLVGTSCDARSFRRACSVPIRRPSQTISHDPTVLHGLSFFVSSPLSRRSAVIAP